MSEHLQEMLVLLRRIDQRFDNIEQSLREILGKPVALSPQQREELARSYHALATHMRQLGADAEARLLEQRAARLREPAA